VKETSNAGDLLDHRLDFVAVVVDAADDDDVLGASGDAELTVSQDAQVAGIEPAAGSEDLAVELGAGSSRW